MPSLRRAPRTPSGLSAEIVPFDALDQADIDLYRGLLLDYEPRPSPFLTFEFARLCSEIWPGVAMARISDENGVLSWSFTTGELSIRGGQLTRYVCVTQHINWT